MNLSAPSPGGSGVPETVADALINFSDTSVLTSLLALLAIFSALVLLTLVSRHLERRTTLAAFDETLTLRFEDLTHLIKDAYINPINAHMEQNFNSPDSPTHVGMSPMGSNSTPRRTRRRSRSVTMLGQGSASTTHIVSNAKSFAINLRDSLSDDIAALCNVDVVFVSETLKDVRQLTTDCATYVLEHRGNDGKPLALSPDNTRPYFIACVSALHATPEYIRGLLTRGFDGILLQGLKQAYDEKAGSQVAWVQTFLADMLDAISAAGKPLLVEVDHETYDLVRPNLQDTNGLFLRNPTMSLQGHAHRGWGGQFDTRDAFMVALKKHISMSIDYSLMSLTCVNNCDALKPELMQLCLRGSWARSIPILHRFCADPTLKNIAETCTPNAPLSALDLMKSGGAMSDLLVNVDDLVVTTNTEDLIAQLASTSHGPLRSDNQSLSNKLREGESGENLKTRGGISSDRLDLHNIEGKTDGALVPPAHCISAQTQSPRESKMTEAEIVDALIASTSDKVKAPREMFDEITASSLSSNASSEHAHFSSVSWAELSDMAHANRANASAGATEWFNASTVVSSPNTPGNILGDAGGQKLVGQKVDRPEYNAIIARLIAQRKIEHKSGCLLQNLSAMAPREEFSGNESKNISAELFDPKFLRIQDQIQKIIERLPERKDITDAVSRGAEFVLGALIDLDNRMVQPVHQVNGQFSTLYSVQLWMCYPRIMSTEVSGTMKTFLALSQNAGEITHIYLSTAHASPIEGVLHSYFQSLGCCVIQ